MAKILAVCISEEKGTPKHDIGSIELIEGYGLSGDAHAGNWHRQVSLLSLQKIDAFRARGATLPDAPTIDNGAFGENLVVDGLNLARLPVGAVLRCGDALLEVTQIGKECLASSDHHRCAIYRAKGDCIMPREGIFARVLRGGTISAGDEIGVVWRFWVMTASDRCSRGERPDESGPAVRETAEAAGYRYAGYTLLNDDKGGIEAELSRICDGRLADLVLTTGGTGFSARDNTPEATIAVCERLAPGISEAIRAASPSPRTMLSRAAAGIRGKTLIINLPGSPKAVRESLSAILGVLPHGLGVLAGVEGD